MNRKLSIFLLLLSADTSAAAAAAETAIDRGICPAEIKTAQSLKGTFDGWTAENYGARHELDGVVIYDGPPSQKMSLKYAGETTAKDGSDVLSWSLAPQYEYWVRCGYFATSVSLIKALPLGTSHCEVTLGAGKRLIGLTCD